MTLSLTASSGAVTSNCTFGYDEWNFRGSYKCSFYAANITHENEIEEIPGINTNPNGNDAVLYFDSVTKVSIIPTVICRQFKKLKYIKFSSKVVSVTNNTFAACTNVVDLNLDFNVMDNIDKDAFTSMKNLEHLRICYTNLMVVPEGLFDSLTNLKQLSLCYNRIWKFEPKTFRSLINLRILHIGGSLYRELDPNLFSSLRNLTELHLTQSNLITLPTGIFNSLVNLNYVHLYNCKFVDFPADTFKSLVRLTSLYMQGNQLTFLRTEWFETLTNLQYLDISGNKIKVINQNHTKSLSNLRYMVMGQSEIEVLPDGIFSNMPLLMTFLAENNNLKTLSSNSFPVNRTYPLFVNINSNGMASIDRKIFDFDLSGIRALNNSCVDKEFWQITNKTEVMSYFKNCFDKFDEENPKPTTETPKTTTEIPNPKNTCNYYIDSVYGYTCELRNIVFPNAASLKLSGKHLNGKNDSDVVGVSFKSSILEKVPPVIFKRFQNLQYLNIKNVSLKVADDSTFPKKCNLKWIDASDNKLKLLAQNSFLQCGKLETLLLDNNLIEKVEMANNFVSSLTRLNYLSLKNNKCVDDSLKDQDLRNPFVFMGKLYFCFLNWHAEQNSP